jgi:predicted esterase
LVALHGGAGNKDSNLKYWEVACQRGWLVLSPQSTQPIYPGAYTWIDPELALEDLQVYFEQILKDHPIDQRRVVIAGFSQGSGIAIYAALSGKINVRGFLAIGTYLSDPGSIRPLAKQATSVRGYFITGEKDRDLHKAREIQNILKENNIPFGEEVHSDLGHEFPLDFVTSFDKAIEFIFMEQE